MDKFDPNSELGVILKRRKQIFLTLSTDENEIERKTIENLRYKPFQPDVYTNWVAETTIEVVDIIDKVTRAQKFQVRYSKRMNEFKKKDLNLFSRRILIIIGIKSFVVRQVNIY